MAFQTKADLRTDNVFALGGKTQTGGKAPTSVEGYYLGSKVTKDTGYGPGQLHIFQTETGNVGVWGKTHLNGLLSSELVGQMCRVTYTGMSTPKKGRRPAYLFKVEHDPENTIDVSSVNAASIEVTDSDDEDTSYESDSYDNNESVVEEEPVVARSVAPKTPVSAPDAARKARVEALLNGRNRKTT